MRDQDLDKLTTKILNSESPGMRFATLVDASHIVAGDYIVSLVVYDKSPTRVDDFLQHETRWVVAISAKYGEIANIPMSKTSGIVSHRWVEIDA